MSKNFSGIGLGLVIGLPMVSIIIFIIVMVNSFLGEQAAQMRDPVYDTPAYAANTAVPDEVDFNDEDVEYVTADMGSVVIPATNSDRTLATYPAGNYTSVYASGDGSEGAGAVEETQSTESGTTTGIVARDGNDISDQIWKDDNVTTYNSFTTTDAVADTNGKLGTLDIPAIGLTVGVFESVTDEMEAMKAGIAHFSSTSSWDGNVALCGHNWTDSGTGAYFKDLHTIKKGATITYTTTLGSRSYKVTTIKTISDTDWSYLNRTDDNRITLVTCDFNDANKRLIVQGIAQ